MSTSPDTRIPKTLVIGLDGGNLEVIRRMAAQGHMPFMASILQQGTSGELRSVFPPLTPPAWATFMTGKNPGKHGIFDFFTYKNSGAPQRIVNSTLLKSDTLWSVLSRAGKRVGLVNVPMTYPPHPVNGVMMTGVLTPSTEQTFTYPETLYDELKPELGEYTIIVKWRGRKPGPFTRDLIRCARQRGKYVRHLMQREPWDFFMVVFSETDSIGHGLWSYLDPDDHRQDDPEALRMVCGFFAELDEQIRRIYETAGEDTRLFFISDHGMGPQFKWLYINTWLCQRGWLAFDPRQLFAMRLANKFQRMLQWQPAILRTVYRLTQLPCRLGFGKKGRSGPPTQDILSAIDWPRTKAFTATMGEQGVRINLQGREPHGTVAPGREYDELREEIIAALWDLRDPETGNKIIEAVWKREELFDGPYAESAPDVLFLCDDARWVADVFPHKLVAETARYINHRYGNGNHRLNGLLIAHGPGIRTRATPENARLQDMLPTLLYAMRQPIPNDVDGRVLAEIFQPELWSAYQPEFTEPVAAGITGPTEDFSEEEEKQVLERLRGLGYIE